MKCPLCGEEFSENLSGKCPACGNFLPSSPNTAESDKQTEVLPKASGSGFKVKTYNDTKTKARPKHAAKKQANKPLIITAAAAAVVITAVVLLVVFIKTPSKAPKDETSVISKSAVSSITSVTGLADGTVSGVSAAESKIPSIAASAASSGAASGSQAGENQIPDENTVSYSADDLAVQEEIARGLYNSDNSPVKNYDEVLAQLKEIYGSDVVDKVLEIIGEIDKP